MKIELTTIAIKKTDHELLKNISNESGLKIYAVIAQAIKLYNENKLKIESE